MLARIAQRLQAIPALLADGVLAVGLMAAADLVAAEEGHLTVLHILTTALITLPVGLRRRWPIATVWWIGVALLLNLGVGFTDSFFETFAGLIAVYTVMAVAAWDRWLALTLAVLVVGLHVSLAVDWHNKGRVVLADLPYNYLIFAIPMALGYGVRSRRDYIEQLQQETRVRAREEERNRIARELHDVVAHSVSVMVLQATAGSRVATRDIGQAAQAFEVIQETGRQALTDLRRVVGVLRADGEDCLEVEPQPGLTDLDALVEQIRRAGMAIELRVDGRRRPLPAGIELSAYRIVQESLTNVLKHAHATRAEVDIGFGDAELRLQISDNGRGHRNPGSGNGLAGMRERVSLYGGDFWAGPMEQGFRVVARLPLEPSPA